MNNLTLFIDQERKSKPILLMTHVVYAYPDRATSLSIMRCMLENGVEILEVQFPFSDPVADGPTITTACHHALLQSPTLQQCLEDMTQLANEFPNSRVLLMSYLNPLMAMGMSHLSTQLANKMPAVIIPDVSVDHADLLSPLTDAGIAPIWIVTPDMQTARLTKITEQAAGMIYCVSRKGVTGGQSSINQTLTPYLTKVRQHTQLPLAVGFGISTQHDVQALVGIADVAIVGSALLNAFNQAGMEGLVAQLKSLQVR